VVYSSPEIDPDEASTDFAGHLCENVDIAVEFRKLSMSTDEKAPLVSIGLPVYNGERYLAEAIESILSQTYSELELIICDNASTDRTKEICRSFVAHDNRVRYFRNASNLGAARNFNLAVEHANGKYFRWAAHDDYIAPEYVAACIEALEADSTLVLCHSQVEIIDENGSAVKNFDFPPDHAASAVPSIRFRDALRQDRSDFEVFGVVPTRVLRRTRMMGMYVASDRVLRAELSLLGRFRILPQRFCFDRDHPHRSIRVYPAHHHRASWFDPSLAGKKIFPHWRVLYEYCRTVYCASVPRWQRTQCYLHIGAWLFRDRNWARLIADLLVAVHPDSWRWMAQVGNRRQ